MAVHLAPEGAGGMVWAPVHLVSIHFSCIPIHVEEKHDGNIRFEDTLLSSLSLFITNDEPVEHSVGSLQWRVHLLEKEYLYTMSDKV